jgi:hypothetical protein
LDREVEQANRTILRQLVWVPLLFLNGAQIADHLEPEALQHLLVFCGQAGQMIGAKNQSLPHLAAIAGPVAAEVTEIDGP